MAKKVKHVVIGPANESTGQLRDSLKAVEEIYYKLRDGSYTKEQAMARIWEEFPKYKHEPADKAWTKSQMPKIIDSILTGSPWTFKSDDEAMYHLHKCIN